MHDPVRNVYVNLPEFAARAISTAVFFAVVALPLGLFAGLVVGSQMLSDRHVELAPVTSIELLEGDLAAVDYVTPMSGEIRSAVVERYAISRQTATDGSTVQLIPTRDGEAVGELFWPGALLTVGLLMLVPGLVVGVTAAGRTADRTLDRWYDGQTVNLRDPGPQPVAV